MFVALHSLRGGGLGPGNHLIDVEAGRSRLERGTRIVVDGASYTVTGGRTVDKAGLENDAAVWSSAPGRLVVITCLQRPDGSLSRDNVVITARLAQPGR